MALLMLPPSLVEPAVMLESIVRRERVMLDAYKQQVTCLSVCLLAFSESYPGSLALFSSSDMRPTSLGRTSKLVLSSATGSKTTIQRGVLQLSEGAFPRLFIISLEH